MPVTTVSTSYYRERERQNGVPSKGMQLPGGATAASAAATVTTPTERMEAMVANFMVTVITRGGMDGFWFSFGNRSRQRPYLSPLSADDRQGAVCIPLRDGPLADKATAN